MSKSRFKPKIAYPRQSLHEIPKEVIENRDLLKIKLNGNNIKSIPKEIENLSRLETLDISGNKITQLYAKFFQLPKLKILNVNNNLLINLPKQLSQLKKLRLLQLSNNKLERLPEEIAELEELREINLSYNNLNNFPKALYKLKNLRTLWIGGNYLSDFPVLDILYELPMLKRFYTHSNINYSQAAEVDVLYKKYNTIKGNNLEDLRKELGVKARPKTEKTIFISYARKDLSWLDRLTPYLEVLQNEGLKIPPWDDRRLAVGDKWQEEIKNKLDNAAAAILLISTHFLASDFITKNELPLILELYKKRGLKIYCLIVGHSRFTSHKELSTFQTANDPEHPLSSLSDKAGEIDRILFELSNSISKDFGSN